MSTRLNDEEGNSFVYLAIVQSPYLDRKVNNFRTDFEISQADDPDGVPSQLALIPDENITRAAIRQECVAAIERTAQGLLFFVRYIGRIMNIGFIFLREGSF